MKRALSMHKIVTKSSIQTIGKGFPWGSFTCNRFLPPSLPRQVVWKISNRSYFQSKPVPNSTFFLNHGNVITPSLGHHLTNARNAGVECSACGYLRNFCTPSKKTALSKLEVDNQSQELKNRNKDKLKQNASSSNPTISSVPKEVAVRKTTGGSASAKKRVKRKTGSGPSVIDEYGYSYDDEESFPITAYAVCDEFDLKDLHKGLLSQGLYIPTVLSDDLRDVIHVSAKYPIGNEPREIFFFREGAVVFWNVPFLERVNVLKFLKEYEDEGYAADEVEEECEFMSYTHSDQGSTRLVRGKVYLGCDSPNKLLEKYTFANALASSVKLGIWEATLEKYVEGIELITDALKRADDIKLSRAEVLQKTGELFALRHQLNLNSDLLDTPDFYWERERLETLYQKTCDYLTIHRRTKVMNEKLSQCCELLDLISSHLTDQHHTRLEWMIIVLIMIEVGFEILHLLERYELIHT